MKFLICHKVIYLLFIATNLTINSISLSKTGNIGTIIPVINSFILLVLNYFLLKNIANKSLNPSLLGIEKALCFCRMMMNLACMIFQAGIIFTPFVALSPVMSSLWAPLAMHHHLSLYLGYIAFFLLVIEIIYFDLLTRNEKQLMKLILSSFQKE